MLKTPVISAFFFLMGALGILASAAQAAETAVSASSRPSEWAQPVEQRYNLFQMSPTLYRSGLPDTQVGPVLDQLKIGTVINFLPEPDSKWMPAGNITQVQLPFRTNHVDDEDVLSTLRAIQSAEQKGPVLMHCKHGLDRTGLMAAMYRIVVQGWSKEQALDEMRNGGFGDQKMLKHGTAYIQQVDVEALRTAYTSGACSTSSFALCSLKNRLSSAGG